MTFEKDVQGGYFINGKAQVLEMMQFLTPEEREKLIRNIRPRNPQLADELAAQSISFNTLRELNDHQLQLVFQYVQAPILGIAMKSMDMRTQRRLLSVAPRTYAEEVYNAMTTRLSNEANGIRRAQEKVKGVIIALMKRKQL